MAINWNKVRSNTPPKGAVLFESGDPGVIMDNGMWANGYSVHGGTPFRSTGANVLIVGLNGRGQWRQIAFLPRPHARALAYLLLLETAGPLERAAVIADARAEGIEIGGITSET